MSLIWITGWETYLGISRNLCSVYDPCCWCLLVVSEGWPLVSLNHAASQVHTTFLACHFYHSGEWCVHSLPCCFPCLNESHFFSYQLISSVSYHRNKYLSPLTSCTLPYVFHCSIMLDHLVFTRLVLVPIFLRYTCPAGFDDIQVFSVDVLQEQ